MLSGTATVQEVQDVHLQVRTSSPATNDIELTQADDVAIPTTFRKELTLPTTPGPIKKEDSPSNLDSSQVEESNEARLERLGRQRPESFHSIWSEIGFVFSISMSQVLSVSPSKCISYDDFLANPDRQEYFVSGFTVILPTLTRELDIPSSSATWPASAFSLVVASFLLIFGRLGDMYGGYPVYVAGLVWLTVWSLVAGFSTNQIMLCICRALQ